MPQKLIFYLLCCITFLFSCAPLPHYFEDKIFLKGQNKGLLVCSVLTDKAIHPSYYIRKMRTNEEIRIHPHGVLVPEEEVDEG